MIFINIVQTATCRARTITARLCIRGHFTKATVQFHFKCFRFPNSELLIVFFYTFNYQTQLSGVKISLSLFLLFVSLIAGEQFQSRRHLQPGQHAIASRVQLSYHVSFSFAIFRDFASRLSRALDFLSWA